MSVCSSYAGVRFWCLSGLHMQVLEFGVSGLHMQVLEFAVSGLHMQV